MVRELNELQLVVKQVETYLGTWATLGDRIGELLGSRSMVEALPNSEKQLLQINGELDRLQSQRRTLEATMCRQVGRINVEAVRTLYTKLSALMEQVSTEMANEARMQSLFELYDRINGFSDVEKEDQLTRMQALERTALARRRVQAAIELLQEQCPVLSTTTIQVIR